MNWFNNIILKLHPYYIFRKAGLALQKNYFDLSFGKMGKNVKVYGMVYAVRSKNIFIGNNSSLNKGCLLNAREKINIGNFCHISPYCQIHTGGLDLTQPYQKRNHTSQEVIIEDGVWLCASSVILPGVKIGEGSVIAAGAVVTKDIPPFELWGGTPAKKIRNLNKNES